MAEETCVLDPVEFIPERVELALDQLGLAIRSDGVDWGEAQITPQMVRQAEGESSSEGHRDGVQIRIPLRVKEEGAVSLAEAAHKLQQKWGTIQDFGGWIRRDFDDGGGFAGSIGYKILRHTASFSGLDGWLFAHNRDAPDVILTATRWPIGYRTKERESQSVKSSPGARHLELVESASPGSGRGLWRGRITNEGKEDLRGLILSRECDYAPEDLEDPTAQMAYEAADLTPMGGAAVVGGSAPEVRAVGNIAAGAGAITPGIPAGTEPGDLLIMVAESGGPTTGTEASVPLTAAGWSSPPAPYESQVKGNTRLTILYRLATGPEDPTLTNDTGDHQAARIIGIKAGTFDARHPFNTAAVGTQAATKAVVIPGGATTRENCLVLACASGNLPDATSTTEFGAATNGSLTELIERIDNTVTSGDGGALYAATGVRAAKGPFGATTLTAVTEAERAVIMLAVNPITYVEHSTLTGGWLTILSSQIAGVGHMTHQGPRPLWMRIFDPGVTAGGVQLQSLVRSTGAARWDESLPIVSTPIAGGWIPINLGVARPEAAMLGNERWEFKLMARAPSGSGAIRIRDVYPLSAEQYCVLSEPFRSPPPDAQSGKAPGTVEENATVGTKTWSNPGNAKASDNSYATVSLGNSSLSHYLVAKGFAFALPEGAIISGILATVERKAGGAAKVRDSHLRIMKAGVIGPGAQADRADLHTYWPEADSVATYGGSEDLWGVKEWSPADINAPNFGVALAVWAENVLPGLEYTASVDQITLTVYYTTAAASDRVCFAARSVELRSDGVARQHPTDETWGALVSDGFLPYVPAGGLEGRECRTVIIPSAGDLASLPDGPNPLLKATGYSREGYHFAPENA